MKHYNVDDELTKIFNQYGAFYAFSDKQFNGAKKEGVTYSSMGVGLICPKENTRLLYDAIEIAVNGAIAWELANNTKKEIIWYQLSNHECQISCDYTDVIGLLGDYGITAEEIKAEWKPYYNHCVENDLF